MANFFYANNVSFLISNSASFAELVEALKRAPQFKFAVAAKSCPARALASPQLKHRQKSCPVPAGGCWKYIKNGPYSTSAEIHKKRFCLLWLRGGTDACFSRRYVACTCGRKPRIMGHRLPELVNTGRFFENTQNTVRMLVHAKYIGNTLKYAQIYRSRF